MEKEDFYYEKIEEMIDVLSNYIRICNHNPKYVLMNEDFYIKMCNCSPIKNKNNYTTFCGITIKVIKNLAVPYSFVEEYDN